MRVQRLSPTSVWVRKPSEFLSAFLKRSAACCLRSASERLPPCSPEHCGRAFSSVLGASASASEVRHAPSANTEIPRPTRVVIYFIARCSFIESDVRPRQLPTKKSTLLSKSFRIAHLQARFGHHKL